VRAWLQTHHLTWLTPRRLRAATIAVFAVAFVISTVGLSGSTPPKHAGPVQTSHSPATPR
jgi:hypothetical protein